MGEWVVALRLPSLQAEAAAGLPLAVEELR